VNTWNIVWTFKASTMAASFMLKSWLRHNLLVIPSPPNFHLLVVWMYCEISYSLPVAHIYGDFQHKSYGFHGQVFDFKFGTWRSKNKLCYTSGCWRRLYSSLFLVCEVYLLQKILFPFLLSPIWWGATFQMEFCCNPILVTRSCWWQ